MKWLRRWLPKQAGLTLAARQRLDAWHSLPEPDLAMAGLGTRYVVVDVESSGLNARRDRLIAIGAVAVESSRIAIDAGFNVVLRQERASDDANILVHRIGGSAQTGGVDPVQASLAFLEYIGKSPLVGYHAAFDEIMISRSIRQTLGESFRRTWIDLAYLAPAMFADKAPTMKGLDDWTAAFRIANFSRHNALADALVTAQLHLVLCARAAEKGLRTPRELLEAAKSQSWLERSRR